MVRFLHTGDWQLGMTRHFLAGEAQARFAQDRIDAVRALGEVARREDCAFVVVGGDVFESNQVDRRTVLRALDALRAVPVPVFLLPGNHDPLDAASIYRARVFREGCPDHVTVLNGPGPVAAAEGVEVVGAPWPSKRPGRDLAAEAVRGLEPDRAVLRVLVAHGAVDVLSPDAADPARIDTAVLEEALADGRIAYVALGDRHSATTVGETGRIRYAGAPEATDYDELEPGRVLVVDLGADGVEAEPHRIGKWRFLRREMPLDTEEDLANLASFLAGIEAKERTVLKLGFTGTLTLARKARLDAELERAEATCAAVEHWERKTSLAVIPEDSDFAGLDLSGFARDALETLRAQALADGPEAAPARDALALLVRLSEEGA